MHSQSSLSRGPLFAKANKPKPPSLDACSRSRANDLLERLAIFLLCPLLILVSVTQVCSQESERVVATVDGAPITLREVDSTAINKIFSLQQQIFALRKAALENLILRKVLEAQAARKNLSVEDLTNQLLALPVTVSASQIEELYTENLSAFASMSPDEAKQKLRLDLETQGRLKRYREELQNLRQTMDIQSFLDEPRLPVPYPRDYASIGPTNALVVVTEFSDFQCPYCREVQSTLKQVMQEYGSEVRLDFRNLPLEQHPLAAIAARAAFCSGKQGRFWNYHSALFAADELTREFLDIAATRSGLNLTIFQECLSSTESRLAVVADIQEAKRLGIESTPTFLINGKLLRGAASFEQFKSIIDRELKALRSSSSTQRR